MEHIKHTLQVNLPRYLRSLPLPDTFEGFAQLGKNDWIKLAPLLMFTFTFFIAIIGPLIPDPSNNKWKIENEKLKKHIERINNRVQLEKEKVVDNCTYKDIEECEKKVMCRCWESKKFPYCDGSHNEHNKKTGDNIGPLIIEGGKKNEE